MAIRVTTSETVQILLQYHREAEAEAEGEAAAEVAEPSWPQLLPDRVCKVLFCMPVYLVEYSLIVAHRILSFPDNFASVEV